MVDFLSQIPDIIKSTLTITCLVMLMLLLIEFINVSSSGKLLERLKHKPFMQIFVATLLGLVPGCLGGFTIVSLYTHQLITFGALVAGMISTFGDEAFVIFAYSPKATLLLIIALIIVALIAGVITHLLFKKKSFYLRNSHTLAIHEEQCDHEHGKIQLSFKNIKKMSFSRAAILFGLVMYLTAVFTGTFSHEHGAMPNMENLHKSEPVNSEVACCYHIHEEAEMNASSPGSDTYIPYYHTNSEHHHNEGHEHQQGQGHTHEHGIFSWENVIFIVIALFTLVIVAFSPEHFLQEHLWEHVIKKHFISILLWTLGVLFFLHLLYYFVDVNALIGTHKWTTIILLFIAIIVGIIPESGPHLIFVVMYFSGAVPFSILLANSVVQDGHGALPLLAYSRKNFLMMKAVNMCFGLLVGLLGYFIGF